MKQKQSEYRDRQRGSATVEAVVGFTAFLLAIFTILGLANFCRAQLLVSAAMDTAAKEMAQYSYFYEISGLSKFEKSLDMNGKKGTDNINKIIGTVDTLYSSVNGAVKQGVTEIKNTQEMVAAGQFDTSAIETSISNVGSEVQGLKLGIEGVVNAFKDVGNDPLLYMRSIVALLASEGMELAKRAVAVPLTKAFVSKHFGDNAREADAVLENLGIVDGLDGMNFNLSKIFSDSEHKEIELVVHYKVKLAKVFDWVILEAKLSKTACCRAWLGGDHVLVTVKPDPAPATPAGDGGGSGESGETGEETPDDSVEDPTDPTDSTEETTAPTEPEKSMNSTGNWALQHDPSGYYHSKRTEAFQDMFEAETIFDVRTDEFVYHEVEGEAVGYGYDVFAGWNQDYYGILKDAGPETMSVKVEAALKEMAKTHYKSDGSVQEFYGYVHTIYVPENIPDDQYNAIVEDAQTVMENMQKMIAEDTTGIPKDLKVTIMIKPAGGQYDYNSKESDYTHLEGARQE